MDERSLSDLMTNPKFRDFLSFVITDLSGIYRTNAQASAYSEGRRSIGLDIRTKLQETANIYRTDYPEFAIFCERKK